MKCSGCGWIYPDKYTAPKCRFCGTTLKQVNVAKVLEVTGEQEHLAAERKACQAATYKRKRARKAEMCNKWIEECNKLKFKALTEEQWLEACAHFGGCVYCDYTYIEARGYFIPYALGGRYTAWNIIPMCEECATRIYKQPNPFMRYLKRPWLIEPIQAYLKKKMEEAYDEQRNEKDSI